MEFLQEYYEVGEMLTKKDRTRLFDAIMDYGFRDTLPDTSNWSKKLKAVWGLAFALVKQTCKKPKQASSENCSKNDSKIEPILEQKRIDSDSVPIQKCSETESILNQNRSENDSNLIQKQIKNDSILEQKRTKNESKTIQNRSKNEQFLIENRENPENTAKTGGFSEPKQAQNPPKPEPPPEKNPNVRERDKEKEKENLPSSSSLPLESNPLIITIKEKEKEKEKENVKNSRACACEIDEVLSKAKPKPKQEKVHYAPQVLLTPEEYDKLVADYGDEVISESIEILDAYKTAKGKRYVSDAGALRSWAIREFFNRQQKAGNAQFATKQAQFGGLGQNPTPSSSFGRNSPNFANSPPKIDLDASTADLMRRGLLANPEDFNPDGSPKNRPPDPNRKVEEDLPF